MSQVIPEKPLRVVVWSTGTIGRHAIAGVDAHPDLELVGVWVSNPDKHGKDAGVLAELGRELGIAATTDRDELMALAPDAVVERDAFIGSMWPDRNLNLQTNLTIGGLRLGATGDFQWGGHTDNRTSRFTAAREAFGPCYPAQRAQRALGVAAHDHLGRPLHEQGHLGPVDHVLDALAVAHAVPFVLMRSSWIVPSESGAESAS